jgi:hypothetical protein
VSAPTGPDETRIRQLLFAQQGLAPDAPSRTKTQPVNDDSWWDRLYDEPADTHVSVKRTTPAKARIGRLPNWRRGETADLGADTADTTADSPDEEPDTKDTDPADKPPTSTDTVPDAADGWEDAPPEDESTPDAARRARTHPARLVHAQFAGLERRAQWLLNTGASATSGWLLGLEPTFAGWITDCGHDNGTLPAVILGVGMVCAGAYINHRARAWWPPLAWVCRIPFATAILALALYAPGATQ